MGNSEGKVVSSIPASGFAALNYSGSNFSEQSRRGTSSSKSSNHFSEQDKEKIKGEREKFLNDSIKEIIIGIEPIGREFGHKISYYANYIGKALLPTYLGGSTIVHHLSCLITLKDCEEKVILEYGAYFGGEPGYKNYIHYFYDPDPNKTKKEGGLRFSKMSEDDYRRKIENGKKGAKIIHFLTINNKMTLNKLIDECCKKGSWKAKDYNLASHNCQDFIAKVIEILKLTRNAELDETRYSHMYGKLMYPPVILNAFEKNDTPLGLRIAEHIPIVNIFTETGVCLYATIKYK